METALNKDKLTDDLPGFDEPLALLRACHEKMLAHCERLEKLIAHIDTRGVDDTARRAVRDITRYFSTGARQHHRDEEEDLFPRLNRQSLKIAELIHKLKQEHQALDALWQEIAAGLGQLPEDGYNDNFRQKVATFCQGTRAHIQLENLEFLPLAASSLSRLELDEIGESMAQRRGVRR
jgi:hemerythrin-like domain-containing protein